MTEDRVRRVAGDLAELACGHRARGDTVTPSGPDLLWEGSPSSARHEGTRHMSLSTPSGRPVRLWERRYACCFFPPSS